MYDSDRTTIENTEMEAQIRDFHQYFMEETESIPVKEERLKALHVLKKQLDVDMLTLFSQVWFIFNEFSFISNPIYIFLIFFLFVCR